MLAFFLLQAWISKLLTRFRLRSASVVWKFCHISFNNEARFFFIVGRAQCQG